MSNESKIGLMAVLVIGTAIWGYKFLQGKNILSSSTELYVEYNDVTELAKSAPVMKNGFQVGVVSDIYLKPDDPEKVIVALDIDRSIAVPKDAKAVLLSLGVMSGRGIELAFDKPCSGGACVTSGDYLQGIEKGLLGSMVDPNEVPVYMNELDKGLKQIMGTMKEEMSKPGNTDSGIGKMAKDLEATMANLKVMTAQMNSLLATNSSSLKGMLSNMESITGNLATNNEKITSMMSNASSFSKQLTEADVKTTIGKANGTLDETTKLMSELQNTLAELDKTLGAANGIFADVSAGKGTLGLLAKDEALYNNLKTASREMELLMQDLRLHPKRYTRILSKKEKPYEYPEGDPARSEK